MRNGDDGGAGCAPGSSPGMTTGEGRGQSGHNSRATHDPVQGDQLKSLVERIERLEEEKATIAADIKEVYGEAKGAGYDVKVLRKVIALRKRDMSERLEEELLIDLYLQAVGQTA